MSADIFFVGLERTVGTSAGDESVKASGGTKNCAVCGEEATCYGQYDGEDAPSYACDECCDHSNEEGECRPIERQVE